MRTKIFGEITGTIARLPATHKEPETSRKHARNRIAYGELHTKQQQLRMAEIKNCKADLHYRMEPSVKELAGKDHQVRVGGGHQEHVP